MDAVVTTIRGQIARTALIVLIVALVLVIGHYGFLAFHARTSPTARVLTHLGFSVGGRAADVPMPPRSSPAFATSSRGRSGRSLAEYASQATPEEVLRFYRAEMPRLGWTERKPAGAAPAQEGLAVLWYSNAAGDSCIIGVSTRAAAETEVTILTAISDY
jgi:hypothetical protein